MTFTDSSSAHIESLFERHPLLAECRQPIVDAAAALVAAAGTGNTILACGNGGSAADAEHLVGELMNKYLLKRAISDETAKALRDDDPAGGDAIAGQLQSAVRAISLVSQSSLATAIANDMSPEMVFAQQVFGYARPGDVLVAISTSGNSSNVVNAVRVARALKVPSIALTGQDGGELAGLCDIAIRVPATQPYLVQELHLPVYHALCAVVESELFGS